MEPAALTQAGPYSVKVLSSGYSRLEPGSFMAANCSCTLISGETHCLIVDTMTAWDKDFILEALEKEGVNPSRVTHCVATHGHYDHVGNMNLFQDAKWHIVGFTVFQPRDKCYLHPFECNEPFIVDDWVRILPTPGHTLSDVTVIVDAVEGMGTVAVAGDLFEKEEDVEDPSLWIGAGSENPAKQKENRWKIASMADWIIPGHGPIFKVTEKHRDNLKSQLP